MCVRRDHSPGSEGLNEDLHTAMEMEDRAEGGLLLDVVVQKGMFIFELFASKDEVLLARRMLCGTSVDKLTFTLLL